MKFIENQSLQFLSNELTRRSGDRVLNGRVEIFSSERDEDDKRLAKSVEKKMTTLMRGSPDLFSSSSIGPMSDRNGRRLLADLITTMNVSFPDHDFSTLTPASFERVHLNSAMQTVNSYLSEIESLPSDFLFHLWEALNAALLLSACEVYTYVPDMEADPFSQEQLWSFNYFFVHKDTNHLLFFTCFCSSQYHHPHAYGVYDEDDDDLDLEDEQPISCDISIGADSTEEVEMFDCDDA